MTDPSSRKASKPRVNDATYTALSSIAPAVASTACCWGPAALSIFAGGASSSTMLSRISRFRPYLLTCSAAMISFSFYKVYFDPLVVNSKHECCETSQLKDAHQKSLSTNRAIVWLSLSVAIAGASYGRVRLPTQFGNIGSKVQSSSARNVKSFTEKAVNDGILRLQVSGMHCGGCANKVQRAIQDVDGVCTVQVDQNTGNVIIEGCGVNDDDVVKSIERLGYSVQS